MKGHIPGAVHLDVYGLSLNDTSEKPFKAFMWMIAYLFQNRGIDPRETIVWYEDISGVRAARGFWFCEYFGHEDVRVLDGGLNAWREAGGEINAAPVEPPEVPAFETPTRPETHINTNAIREMLDQADFAVLDTRSANEHYGRVARAARGGAIPGSIHIEWINNLGEKGKFKPAAELKAMYEAAGVTPDKRIMCY
jgi:thiosulfate/3-mercaptopyruvate sulfurtransferase